MFHKKLSQASPNPISHNQLNLRLIPSGDNRTHRLPTPAFFELVVITARRCSSFFAEAAVLVLVFGILDFFILKGRIELTWIVGALSISLCLLIASIATDWTANRWIKAHP